MGEGTASPASQDDGQESPHLGRPVGLRQPLRGLGFREEPIFGGGEEGALSSHAEEDHQHQVGVSRIGGKESQDHHHHLPDLRPDHDGLLGKAVRQGAGDRREEEIGKNEDHAPQRDKEGGLGGVRRQHAGAEGYDHQLGHIVIEGTQKESDQEGPESRPAARMFLLRHGRKAGGIFLGDVRNHGDR